MTEKRNSPKQGTASIRKTVKPAPEEQQHYLSTLDPLKEEDVAIRIPVKSAADKQQDYITMDAGGSKLAAAEVKPHKHYVKLTGGGKSAVKAPNPVIEKDGYWMCTGEQKSVKKEGYYWMCTGDPKSVKKEGYYWICTGDPKSVKQEGGYWVCTGELKSQLPPQRNADGSVKGFYADHRKLCISIVIIVGLILLAGVAVGMYFLVYAASASTSGTISSTINSTIRPTIRSTMHSTISSTIRSATASTTHSTSSSTLSPVLDEDGLLAYEAICVPQYDKVLPAARNVNWKECIVGPPPRHDSCSGNATCILYRYRLAFSRKFQTMVLDNKSLNDTMEYDKKAVPHGKKNATQLLCRTTSDKLGLCNGTTCTGARVEDNRNWYEESKWEDNCDEPNMCWQHNPAIGLLSIQHVTRAGCLNMDTTACGQAKHRAVVVWMQHLRCDSGKDRSRMAPCPGIPLKLWVCAKCNRSVTSMDFVNDQCEQGARTTWACAFRCKLRETRVVTTVILADGAECLNSTDGSVNTGYCFKQTCFHNFMLLNETNRHELDKTGCRNKTLK